MKAGLLDERVIFEQRTDSKNAYGEEVPVWSTFSTVWADVITTDGDERYTALRDTARVRYRVRIRYLTNLSTKMRMVYLGENYNIYSIKVLGRKEAMEVLISQQEDML